MENDEKSVRLVLKLILEFFINLLVLFCVSDSIFFKYCQIFEFLTPPHDDIINIQDNSENV